MRCALACASSALVTLKVNAETCASRRRALASENFGKSSGGSDEASDMLLEARARARESSEPRQAVERSNEFRQDFCARKSVAEAGPNDNRGCANSMRSRGEMRSRTDVTYGKSRTIIYILLCCCLRSTFQHRRSPFPRTTHHQRPPRARRAREQISLEQSRLGFRRYSESTRLACLAPRSHQGVIDPARLS